MDAALSFITVSTFQRFFQYLKEEKYVSIFLDEWYDVQKSNLLLDNKKLVITFDGYLDNRVSVYSIIKKYGGLKIAIFVNLEFVDPSEAPRPTLENDWNNNLSETELQSVGFLNWDEMHFMVRTGLIDIQ